DADVETVLAVVVADQPDDRALRQTDKGIWIPGHRQIDCHGQPVFVRRQCGSRRFDAHGVTPRVRTALPGASFRISSKRGRLRMPLNSSSVRAILGSNPRATAIARSRRAASGWLSSAWTSALRCQASRLDESIATASAEWRRAAALFPSFASHSAISAIVRTSRGLICKTSLPSAMARWYSAFASLVL